MPVRTTKNVAARARRGTCAVVVLLVACGSAAWATGPAPEPRAEPLRAELQTSKPLYRTDGPLRVRFTLLNTSAEAVDIPLDPAIPAGDGIALPVALMVGMGEHRVLSIALEDEAPKPVVPPAQVASPGETQHVLRLAPHAVLGADVDLRAWYHARYAGNYRLEWRPLDGRLGTITAQFRVEPRKEAILVTDQGKITFTLNYDDAPRNVENFLDLVNEGFYNGKTIHRLIPGFIMQGGCPKGDGTGIRKDGRLIPAELQNYPVEAGTLMMAAKPSDPNSASCQFIVAFARLEELDGQYTVIGQARDEESLRALQAIAALPTDRRNHPVNTLVIRSINLVAPDDETGRRLELRREANPTPPPPLEKPTDSRPAEP